MMDDLISRQAALECVYGSSPNNIKGRIVELPTAEPRKGKWVYDEERGATGIYAICTACNEIIYQTGEFNYCPNCGAKMEVEHETDRC